MTATVTADYAAPVTYDRPVCRSCGGPCWQWRGSVHGFTCSPCSERYLEAAAAKADARDAKVRDKALAKLFRNNNSPPVKGGRRGDDLGYVPVAPASTDQEKRR